MSIPYFPFYPTDYDGKTAHLSLSEDGAYNRLLRLQWAAPGCKLPADLPWIMRKMRAVTPEDQAVVTTIIGEFFTRKGGKIFNERLLKEWVKANDAHAKRILAGSKGGTSKALKSKDLTSSNAVAMPYQPEPEPEPEPEPREKKEDDAQARLDGISPPEKPPPKARLPSDWTLSDEGWAYARSQKIPDEVIEDEARGFHAYWTDRRDRDASKSDRGWEQCWASQCRRIAPKYQSRGGVAGSTQPFRSGQGASLASIVAQRRIAGIV